MKKALIIALAVLFFCAVVVAWLVLGSGTGFTDKTKSLYIFTGKADKETVLQSIKENELLAHPTIFILVANQLNLWPKLKPGKFEIKRGENVLSIVKKLRNNQQTPVKLVVNKLRTINDLAHVIGKNFEVDSTQVLSFLNNPDSLSQFKVDSNTVMTIIVPNTYSIYWNTDVRNIFKRLNDEQQTFWNKDNRTQKAGEMAFTPQQVYTIASIVEEETNKNDEKGKVASVYINRFNKGMPLGADPTIKFALKDFGLRRIYFKHLAVQSPYNTYRNKGLPPGPICTPSTITIDAVLNAPKTDYLFFVAKSDFSGYHTFSENFAEHKKNAEEYQKALDALILRKQKAKQTL